MELLCVKDLLSESRERQNSVRASCAPKGNEPGAAAAAAVPTERCVEGEEVVRYRDARALRAPYTIG